MGGGLREQVAMSERSILKIQQCNLEKAIEVDAEAHKEAVRLILRSEAFVIIAKVGDRQKTFTHANLENVPGLIDGLINTAERMDKSLKNLGDA